MANTLVQLVVYEDGTALGLNGSWSNVTITNSNGDPGYQTLAGPPDSYDGYDLSVQPLTIGNTGYVWYVDSTTYNNRLTLTAFNYDSDSNAVIRTLIAPLPVSAKADYSYRGSVVLDGNVYIMTHGSAAAGYWSGYATAPFDFVWKVNPSTGVVSEVIDDGVPAGLIYLPSLTGLSAGSDGKLYCNYWAFGGYSTNLMNQGIASALPSASNWTTEDITDFPDLPATDRTYWRVAGLTGAPSGGDYLWCSAHVSSLNVAFLNANTALPRLYRKQVGQPTQYVRSFGDATGDQIMVIWAGEGGEVLLRVSPRPALYANVGSYWYSGDAGGTWSEVLSSTVEDSHPPPSVAGIDTQGRILMVRNDWNVSGAWTSEEFGTGTETFSAEAWNYPYVSYGTPWPLFLGEFNVLPPPVEEECGDPYPIAVTKTEIPKDAQHEGLKPLSRDGIVYYPYATRAQVWVAPTYNTGVILSTTIGLSSNTNATFGSAGAGTYTNTFSGGWTASQTFEETSGSSSGGIEPGQSYSFFIDGGAWPTVYGDLIVPEGLEGLCVDYAWTASGSWETTYSSTASSNGALTYNVSVPPGSTYTLSNGYVLQAGAGAEVYGELIRANGDSICYLKFANSGDYEPDGSMTASGNAELIYHQVTLDELRTSYMRSTISSYSLGYHYVKSGASVYSSLDYSLSISTTASLTSTPSLVVYYHPVVPGYWIDDDDPSLHWYSNVIRAWKGNVDQEQWVLPETFTYGGETGYWANNGQFPFFYDWSMDGNNVYILTQYCLDPDGVYYNDEPYVVWRINWDTGDMDMMGIPMCANNANTPSFEAFLPQTILAAGGYVFVGGGKAAGNEQRPGILRLPHDAPTQSAWETTYADYGNIGMITTLVGESGTNKWYATADTGGSQSYELLGWGDGAWIRIRTDTHYHVPTAIWAKDDTALFYEANNDGHRFLYTTDAGSSWTYLCSNTYGNPTGVYGGLPWHEDYVLFPVRSWPLFSGDNWNMGILKIDQDELAPVSFLGNTQWMPWGGPWFGTADATAVFPPGVKTTPGQLSWAQFLVPLSSVVGTGTRVLFGSGYTNANLRDTPRTYAITQDGGATWSDATSDVVDINAADYPDANATYPFYLALVQGSITGEAGDPVTAIRDANGVVYRVVWQTGAEPPDYWPSQVTLAVRGFVYDTSLSEYVDYVFAQIPTLDVYSGQPSYPTDFCGWAADATNFYLAADQRYAHAIWQINRTTGSMTTIGTDDPAASHTDHGTAFEYTGNAAAIYPHTFQGMGMLDGAVHLGGTDSVTWTGLLRIEPDANVCSVIYGPERAGFTGDPWILGVRDGDPDLLWITYGRSSNTSHLAASRLYTYAANGQWTRVDANLHLYGGTTWPYQIHPLWAGSGGRCLVAYQDSNGTDYPIKFEWTNDAGQTWELIDTAEYDANSNGWIDLSAAVSVVESNDVITVVMNEWVYTAPYTAYTSFHVFQFDAITGQGGSVGPSSSHWETGDVGISIPGSVDGIPSLIIDTEYGNYFAYDNAATGVAYGIGGMWSGGPSTSGANVLPATTGTPVIEYYHSTDEFFYAASNTRFNAEHSSWNSTIYYYKITSLLVTATWTVTGISHSNTNGAAVGTYGVTWQDYYHNGPFVGGDPIDMFTGQPFTDPTGGYWIYNPATYRNLTTGVPDTLSGTADLTASWAGQSIGSFLYRNRTLSVGINPTIWMNSEFSVTITSVTYRFGLTAP